MTGSLSLARESIGGGISISVGRDESSAPVVDDVDAATAAVNVPAEQVLLDEVTVFAARPDSTPTSDESGVAL